MSRLSGAVGARQRGRGRTGSRDVTHLIWPESAFPFFLTREADALAQIAALLHPRHRADHRRACGRSAPSAAGRIARAYNSVYVIDHDGTVLSRLRQGASGAVRRVPAVPGRARTASDCTQLTKVRGGFVAGDRRRPMTCAGRAAHAPADLLRDRSFPARPCRRGERPGWLLNLTNDGWFGISTRALPALSAGAPSGDRGRPAAGPRREYRHLGGGRSRRPRRRGAAARDRGRSRGALPQPITPTLYARIGDCRSSWRSGGPCAGADPAAADRRERLTLISGCRRLYNIHRLCNQSVLYFSAAIGLRRRVKICGIRCSKGINCVNGI